MNDNMNSDEKIQHIYNATKHISSPADLDNLILGKVRALEEQTVIASSKKSWVYLPIAASILLAVIFQIQGGSDRGIPLDKPIEIVQLPIDEPIIAKQNNKRKNQLPKVLILPSENINSKILPACTGELIEPENEDDLTNLEQSIIDQKTSDLPIQLIYPNKRGKQDTTSVSRQIFKK